MKNEPLTVDSHPGRVENTMTEPVELLPCPLDGMRAVFQTSSCTAQSRVVCACGLQTRWHVDEAQAAAAWNTRAPSLVDGKAFDYCACRVVTTPCHACQYRVMRAERDSLRTDLAQLAEERRTELARAENAEVAHEKSEAVVVANLRRAEIAEKRLAASLRVIRTIADEGEERGHAWIRIHGRAFLASLLPEDK